MWTGWLLVLAACSLSTACNAPSSSIYTPSAVASISAAATSVRITRDPGLFIMPPLDQTITNRQTVRRLANDILALPAFPSGTYSCPIDFGTTYTLRFTGGAPWSAMVNVRGCQGVRLSNGRNLWALTTLGFVPDLAAALGLAMSDFSPMPCQQGQTRCYPQPHMNMGLVTGGIVPCAGIPVPNGPHYAAGIVTGLQGRLAQQNQGPLLPQGVFATQAVTLNHGYLLALPPGDYVLEAQFPPPANIHPFIAVSVGADAAVHVDIPNMCK